MAENKEETAEYLAEIKRLSDIIENLNKEIKLLKGGEEESKIKTFTHKKQTYRFTTPSPTVPKLLPFQSKETAQIMPNYSELEGENLTLELITKNPKILEVFAVCGFQLIQKI